jgi:hypothetical protein
LLNKPRCVGFNVFNVFCSRTVLLHLVVLCSMLCVPYERSVFKHLHESEPPYVASQAPSFHGASICGQYVTRNNIELKCFCRVNSLSMLRTLVCFEACQLVYSTGGREGQQPATTNCGKCLRTHLQVRDASCRKACKGPAHGTTANAIAVGASPRASSDSEHAPRKVARWALHNQPCVKQALKETN